MKTKLIILGILFFILQTKIKAQQEITIDLTKKENLPDKNIFNFKRNSVFKLIVIHLRKDSLDLKRNNKNIAYTSLQFGGERKINNDKRNDTFIMSFQIISDAIEFKIKLIDTLNKKSKDSFEYLFTVFAKKYMTVMPTGGLALMKFKNQRNYYYVAKEDPIGAPFRGDSSYTFNLMSKQQGWSSNLYLGSNFNFIFNNTASIGLTTAFGYNIGANTTPLNAILGGNLTLGNKIKFTFSGGLSFMQIETIADEYLTQSIYTKFSTLPSLPTKINQWSTGYYFSFGVTLATLTDN